MFYKGAKSPLKSAGEGEEEGSGDDNGSLILTV